MSLREACCEGKIPYPSWHAAWRVLRKPKRRTVKIFHCPFCKQYHFAGKRRWLERREKGVGEQWD